MKFVNETSDTVRFSLRGEKYAVEPGGQADVPDRLGYAVAAMKLPLRCISGPAKDPEKPAVAETLELWRDRAEAERRRADAAEAQARRLSDRLDGAQTEHRKFLDAQSTTEQDLREQARGYREQVTQLQGQLDAVTKDRDDLLEAATRADTEKKPKGGGGQRPS